MTREFIAKVMKFTMPVTYITAALCLIGIYFTDSVFIPIAVSAPLFVISLVNMFFALAGSHSDLEYDGTYTVHFTRWGFVAGLSPLVIGLFGIEAAGADYSGLSIFVALIMLVVMIAGWVVCHKVAKKYAPIREASLAEQAAADLARALDKAGLTGTKRAKIEARAASATTDEIFEMANALRTAESSLPELLD